MHSFIAAMMIEFYNHKHKYKHIPYSHFIGIAFSFQCGLGVIIHNWAPSSEDVAMFYSVSLIWGSVVGCWEFIITCK